MPSTDNVFDIIETAASTSKKIEKQAILTNLPELGQRIVRLALDPTTTYYIANLPAPSTVGTEEWSPDDILLLSDLALRKLTGNAALEAVNKRLTELTHKSGELLRRVILKDLRAGFGASTVNKAFPGLVPEFAYMRCSLPKASHIKKWDWSVGIFSQLKANGMFDRVAVGDSTVLFTTRQGNTFPAGSLGRLVEDASWTFPDNTETHGELTVWRNGELLPRSEGNGLLNSVMQGEPMPEGHEVRFDAWDQIPLNKAVPGGFYSERYEDRFARLSEQISEAGKSSILLIESKRVYSYAEAMEHYRGVLGRKLEGTVLKHPDAPWIDGDSKDQVKLKMEVDVDLKIIGFNPGKPGTRTEKTFGSLQLATSDGLLEASAAGFKRDLETWLHENREKATGMIATIRANEVSPPCDTNPLHSLYHPRVVEIRHDKTEADSLQRVLDQFEAAVTA